MHSPPIRCTSLNKILTFVYHVDFATYGLLVFIISNSIFHTIFGNFVNYMMKGVPTFEDWISRLLGGGCAGAKSGFNEKMASTSICQINEMSFFFLIPKSILIDFQLSIC